MKGLQYQTSARSGALDFCVGFAEDNYNFHALERYSVLDKWCTIMVTHTYTYMYSVYPPHCTYTYPFTSLVPRPLPDFISQLWRKSGSGLRMLLPFVMLTTPQCTHTHTNPFLPPSPSPPSLLYIPRLCILQHWPSIALFPGHYQILFRCRSKRSGCKIKKIWGGQGTCKST